MSPQAASIAVGDTATYTVTTMGINGFGDNVYVAVSVVPDGTAPAFSVDPIPSDGSSTLSIATDATTAPGDYQVTITAYAGSLAHSQTVTLTVT